MSSRSPYPPGTSFVIAQDVLGPFRIHEEQTCPLGSISSQAARGGEQDMPEWALPRHCIRIRDVTICHAYFRCALIFQPRPWNFYWESMKFLPIFHASVKQLFLEHFPSPGGACSAYWCCWQHRQNQGITRDPVWVWQLFHTVVAPREPSSWHCQAEAEGWPCFCVTKQTFSLTRVCEDCQRVATFIPNLIS